MIIALSGSSCSGKNTIIKELLKINKGLEYIKSCTTRAKRTGESEGNPYHFYSVDDFQNKIKNGDFFEYELIHNNFYGIEKHICQETFKQNKNFIKDMGVIGTSNLKENITDQLIETIFLFVKKGELKKRLKLRGDSQEQIKLRLKRYKFENNCAKKYNFVIDNNNKENTIKIINKILAKNKDSVNYIKLFNKKINVKKLEKYKKALINNKCFKPIKLYFNGKDFYLKKNYEKYLASIITNKNLAKKIVIIKEHKKDLKSNFKTGLDFIKELNLN